MNIHKRVSRTTPFDHPHSDFPHWVKGLNMEQNKPNSEEKLCKRIQREFERKKLLGDISISDEEYEILIQYLKNKLRWLKKYKLKSINDRILCVALVQIGIRHYDGSYWPHAAKELGLPSLSIQDQEILGTSFFRTMNAREKYVLGSSDRVSAILMQGFVCNNYAPKLFDYLYAFYNIDLERDLSRLDRNAMQELIEVMQRTDNTGRTYQLVGQTANAVRLHPRGAKTRIRRYLRLIDRAFWNEQLPENSQNRLIRRFLEWADTSEDIQSAHQKHLHRSKQKKLYSSPYLKLQISDLNVCLVLPPQHLRFSDYQDLTWSIRIGERKHVLPISLYTQGVIGYKTEEASILLDKREVLKAIMIRIMNGDTVLRVFEIKAKQRRFFNENGNPVPSDHLQPGIVFSLSALECKPVSNALQMQKDSDGLCCSSYLLEEGDLICFPKMPPIAVGTKIANGLMLRNRVSGVRYKDEDNTYPVYSAAPTLILTLSPQRIAGTAIIVNDFKYPLMRDGSYLNGCTSFPMQDGTDTVGIMVSADLLHCSENGVYSISVDAPGRSSVTTYRFLLLQRFKYGFADAPYLFNTHGTLCLPYKYPLDHKKADRTAQDLAYEIDLTAGSNIYECSCCGYPLEFEIPVLRYRFEGEQWMTAAHIDVWHSAFQPKLEIQAPGTQIIFSLDEYGNDSEDEEEHEDTFTRSASDQIFHCDLTRFHSWFGRNSAKRIIYIQCAGMDKRRKFLGVVTRSVLISGTLTASDNREELIGSFQIIGMAEYYADLFFGTECIAEKILMQNGQFTIHTQLRSGIYTAVIYEAEEDEYGFGTAYYQIGTQEMQIIDPNDLTGRSVQITQIQPLADLDSYLILYYNYLIIDLQKYQTESDTYSGKMIVKTSGGTVKATFPVYVTIPDPHEINAGYVTFDEDGEAAAFLYDSVEHSLVKYADHRKGKSLIYRRYDPVLWQDEYLFRFSFIIPAEEDYYSEADETEYNNLNYH